MVINTAPASSLSFLKQDTWRRRSVSLIKDRIFLSPDLSWGKQINGRSDAFSIRSSLWSSLAHPNSSLSLRSHPHLDRILLQIRGVPFPWWCGSSVFQRSSESHLQPRFSYLPRCCLSLPDSSRPVRTYFYFGYTRFRIYFSNSIIFGLLYGPNKVWWLASPHLQTCFLNFHGLPPVFTYTRWLPFLLVLIF